ncbi:MULTISPECIES: SDR family NAD(P)-dependent oxidoreductase [Chryseobacterium]|uniref:NAD(P)-dependent dehydrogenase (Short-subunit alcohol dehydrogenase family) n=1 Tax=Chryseobacterium geocarposphaerae TaxID=1416776 RepID=A0ABU1L9R3_9FLAO|nr:MULTISPECIES: SDR family NAD(P)-dependent oxidoreductase [Chryseobacterium]MDR6403453.1 NAD(P)-dependent dehydrogenase (short-subunit alcohol dehydrogenase family) [Chryseobacterium geocarposphaerae]MDR6697007.1 NAD(P)-dependent dehydrogenase (short-subunit alcohol dehydrogenase family) [Chryseobacterium ginsenosidimutans]
MNSALITGANRSIGLEIAKQLSQKGLSVYLGSRNLENGETVVKELTEQGFQNIKAIEIDVTNPESISKARDIIETEQGKLDILINNAGILGPIPQTAAEASIKDIQNVFDTNFFGVISVTQAFLDLLKKSDRPRISNITSGLGSLTLHSDPNWKYYNVKGAAYGPSKSALNAYTIVLAYELKDSAFKVNVIDPGYTATDFNHHSGPGSVESAASFIIKHTLTDENGPTGQYFSNDIEDESGISPW